MVHTTSLPDDLFARAFPVGVALQAGASASRLRGPDLSAPFWGVRSFTSDRAAPDDPQGTTLWRARAFLSRAHDEAVISHSSAAAIWRMPLPARLQFGPLDVSVPHSRRAPRGKGAAGHNATITLDEVVAAGGVRVTSQLRTFLDLATVLTEEELLAVGDFLIWRRRPASIRFARGDIERVVASSTGRAGSPQLRAVVPLITDRADSPAESLIRHRIIRGRLPQVVVNPEIYDEHGTFDAMVDLAFPDFKVALDYEGDHHRTDAPTWRKDLRRVPRLDDLGWHHTRLSADDLIDSSDFLARTARRLRARGWDGVPGI